MREGQLDGKRNRGEGATEKTDSAGSEPSKAGQQTHAGQSPAGEDIVRKNGIAFQNHFCHSDNMMRVPEDDLAPTRHSLLARLKDWQDQRSWREFFDAYWRLIYWTALKAGLSPDQAQDIVQETMIVVARNIHKFKPGRENGSFRGWLRNVTRWRLADHFQGRHKSLQEVPEDAGVDISQIPDPAGADLEAIWETEWENNLVLVATDRVKARVKAEHYQAFDLCVAKGWPARKVAQYLKISVAAVYVAKHRVQSRLRAEVRRLRKRHQ